LPPPRAGGPSTRRSASPPRPTAVQRRAIGGSRGISLSVVEKDTPGFEPGRVLDKIRQPEADTAELFLIDVHVPAHDMIGELDEGFVHIKRRTARAG
jgi:alkylation response protein AidB-like acyl-CoA dehydrogenase